MACNIDCAQFKFEVEFESLMGWFPWASRVEYGKKYGFSENNSITIYLLKMEWDFQS